MNFNKNNISYFITALALICCTLLVISYQTLWAKKRTPVTIAVSKTPLSGPFYVAMEKGFFDNTCVDVTIEEVIGGKKAFEHVMNGKADFGTSSDSVIAFKSLEQKSFVTHATFVQSDNDVKIITRSSDFVQTAAQLKNKKIGVTRDSAGEYFLSIFLALEGITINDITIDNVAPNKLLQAFVDNKVDAIVSWEPFVFKTINELKEKAHVHDTKNLYTLTFNLISKKTLSNEELANTKCVLEGINLAINFIASNPEATKEIITKKLKISKEFVNWVWSDYIFKLSLNRALLLNIESQAIWAKETKMTEHSAIPDIKQFIDTRALSNVLPMAVNIDQ